MNDNSDTQFAHPIGIDLFAGVGGMSLGFELAGFNVIAAVELDAHNINTYQENFPHSNAIQADISILSGKELLNSIGLPNETIDIVFGGPPCQGFSMIGKRQIDDERNKLLYHFARLVREINPNYFVMENVPGLLMGNAISIFESFKRRVKRAGYSIVEPVQILNAADFGIPQKRLRTFIIGYKKGLDTPCYPTPLSKIQTDFSPPTVWDAIGDLSHLDTLPELYSTDRFHGELGSPSSYIRTLNSIYDSYIGSKPINGNGLGGCRLTKHSTETRRRFDSTAPGSSETISRFSRLSCDGVAPTLRAGTGPDHGSHTAARPIHPKMPRCITTREAARLHSYPDWFEFNPTKWHGFRQIGNSVPPLMAYFIGQQLLKSLISRGRK